VAQFVQAPRYIPVGRGLDSRCCHRNFLLAWYFRPHYGPGVDLASDRNEYQGISWGLRQPVRRVDNLPPSCADCHEILEPHPPGTLRAIIFKEASLQCRPALQLSAQYHTILHFTPWLVILSPLTRLSSFHMVCPGSPFILISFLYPIPF